MPRASRVQDRGFWFACTTCKSRNYTSVKNRRNDPDRLTLRKYCPTCRQHTEHRETAIGGKGRK